jgi:xylulokinase
VPLVAGVDSSTQSTKLELRDAHDGRLVASARAPHPPTTPPVSEQRPDAWWDALVAAAEATPQADRGSVAAVSIAAQQHGLVITDAGGTPLRPAPLWNDATAAPDARRLVDELGHAAWAEAVGSIPVASFTVAKLAHLAATEPEVLSQVEHLCLPHDWLTHRLTGGWTTDRGDASGTGWWSPVDGAVRPDLLSLAAGDGAPAGAWDTVLPEVLGPTDSAGTLTDAAAVALGVPGGIAVGPGTGDNMAAALALGLRAGDVVISLGTSGTVFAVSDTPTADPTGAVAGFADATGRFLPLVCTLNATKVTDAAARLLGVELAELDDLALAARPGADGLVLVPYLDGERTPPRPDATGTLTGMRSDTSRAAFARAAFEGVVCGLLDGLDALCAAGVAVDGRLLIIGGGARSAAYRQIVADLAQRSVLMPDSTDQVALGACVQAAAVLTDTEPDAVAERWGLTGGTTVEPGGGAARSSEVRTAYARARG